MPVHMATNIVTTVFAVLAPVSSVVLYLTPTVAVVKLRLSHQLGALDGFPYCFMALQAIMWCGYALFANFPAVYAGSVPGVLIGLICSMMWYGHLEYEPHEDKRILQFEIATAVCISFSLLVFGILGFAVNSNSVQTLVMGVIATVVDVVFDLAPLIDVPSSCRKGDSASIDLPLAIIFVVSNSLWTVYGGLLVNPYIIIGGVAGVISGIVQLITILACRPKHVQLQEHTHRRKRKHRHKADHDPVVETRSLGVVL